MLCLHGGPGCGPAAPGLRGIDVVGGPYLLSEVEIRILLIPANQWLAQGLLRISLEP